MENYHHHHQWQLRQEQFQQHHPLFSFQDNIQELQQQFQQQLELQTFQQQDHSQQLMQQQQFQQQDHSQQLMQQQQFQQEEQQDHSQQQFQEQRPLYPLQQQQFQQDHSQQQFQEQQPLYPLYFQDHIHIQMQQQFQQEEGQQQDHSRQLLMHQQFQQEQQDHSRQLFLMQQEFQQKQQDHSLDQQQLMQQQFQQDDDSQLLMREQHQSAYFTDHPFQQQHPFYFPNHPPPQPLTLLQPQAHHQEQGVLNNFPNRVLVFNDSADYPPPGYRFCPTDEELVSEYLIKSKHDHEQQPSSSRQRRIHRIHEVDIYKENPESLTRQYPLSDADMKYEWYFLTPLERKYPKGNRPSRKCVGTGPAGYWKPTGKDTEIKVGDVVAKKKFLDFMEGTAPAGRKTDWKMHEYRIVNDDSTPKHGDQHKEKLPPVLCRIYVNTRKKDKEGEGSSSRDDDESI